MVSFFTDDGMAVTKRIDQELRIVFPRARTANFHCRHTICRLVIERGTVKRSIQSCATDLTSRNHP